MIQAKQDLLLALGAAIQEVSPHSTLTPVFELPRQVAHGDLACTAAMQLAKPLRQNPRELAQALIDALQRQPAVQRPVESMQMAGPGFINLHLPAAPRQAGVSEARAGGDGFGCGG